MPGLHTVALHSLRHHAPVILLAHRLLYRLGVVVEFDTSIQHAGVGHILLHMSVSSMVVSALVAPVVEISDSSLVHLVVGIKPGKQHLKRRVRINLLEFVLISIGQTANRDERIAASSTTTNTVYATACRELLVVGYGHHTAIHKFPHRDAKSVIVVLHNSASRLFAYNLKHGIKILGRELSRQLLDIIHIA